MAEFLYEGKKVYYEVHGESGQPLVILNGIMMSTASWKSFIPNFSRDNIVILVDFLDQGQSERMTTPYNHEIQVNVLEALLDLLPYERYNVMGISYGGEIVPTEFAALCWQTPLCAHPIGFARLATAGMPWQRRVLARRIISPPFP